MINKWIVNEPLSGQPPIGCILALPGRGIEASFMDGFISHSNLWQNLTIAIEPKNMEWYPQPNGVDDQQEAVEGLPDARNSIEKFIGFIQNQWGLERNKIGLVGFSAGGVMTLDIIAHSKLPLAGGVCLGGAILEPKDFPLSQTDTPIAVQHNMDDNCFDWHERYVPTKQALKKNKYNVKFEERYMGGHRLCFKDVALVKNFFSNIFEYNDEDFNIEKDNDE